MFDVSDASSFESVSYWIQQARQSCPDTKLMIVGTKTDKENRLVDQCRAQALALEYNALYAETSSKSGTNVETCFHNMSKLCLSEVKKNSERVNLNKKPKQPTCKCN